MYKFVNPFKYLSKAEKIMLIVATVLSLVAVVLAVLPSSLVLRVISMLVFLGANTWGMFYILKIQAHITRQELASNPYNTYTPDSRNYNDDEEDDTDNDEEEEEDDEDYDETQK